MGKYLAFSYSFYNNWILLTDDKYYLQIILFLCLAQLTQTLLVVVNQLHGLKVVVVSLLFLFLLVDVRFLLMTNQANLQQLPLVKLHPLMKLLIKSLTKCPVPI